MVFFCIQKWWKLQGSGSSVRNYYIHGWDVWKMREIVCSQNFLWEPILTGGAHILIYATGSSGKKYDMTVRQSN